MTRPESVKRNNAVGVWRRTPDASEQYLLQTYYCVFLLIHQSSPVATGGKGVAGSSRPVRDSAIRHRTAGLVRSSRQWQAPGTIVGPEHPHNFAWGNDDGR